MVRIRSVLGEIPLIDAENRRQAGEKPTEDSETTERTPSQLVTSDGTYASQSAFSTASSGSF